MLESTYQSRVIKKIKKMLPGCKVLKNDANYIQGIPDWTILYGPRWAMLEIKRSEKESVQPNQPWYVEWAYNNSFGAFIFPENEEEVLDALYRSFTS